MASSLIWISPAALNLLRSPANMNYKHLTSPSLWEHDGQKHSRLRVIGENLQLLGKRLDPGPSSTTQEESTIAPVPTPSSARPPVRVPIEPNLDVEPF